MLTLKTISYMTFDGQQIKGAVNKNNTGTFEFLFFTKKVKPLLATVNEIDTMRAALSKYRTTKDKSLLTFFGGRISVAPESVDELEKELGVIVGSWEQFKP